MFNAAKATHAPTHTQRDTHGPKSVDPTVRKYKDEIKTTKSNGDENVLRFYDRFA